MVVNILKSKNEQEATISSSRAKKLQDSIDYSYQF